MSDRLRDRMNGDGCRICAGPLEPFRRGRAERPAPEDLAPSNHRPGEHGDLVRCPDCGAVQQPGLPSGAALHDLYRRMSDEHYLAEQQGRRATARRVLRTIAAHVPAGRLLDVGCGHGLLLDEARRMGYDTLGLELSRTGAGHARDVLGLEVCEEPVEDFAMTAERFDVVVLADVLEHTVTPERVLAEVRGRLAPGGTVLVSIPNFAHWYPRLRVAAGRFDYDRRGILDRGHVRFFTDRSFRRLAADAGYRIPARGVTGLPIEVAERGGAAGRSGLGGVGEVVGRVDRFAARQWPTMFGYQLLYELVPT